MKMEVRVFANTPIMTDEITAWFKEQEPRIPITVSVVERSDEHRTAVYALFLDAPVVASVAVAAPAVVGGEEHVNALQLLGSKCEEHRLENEALLDLLEKWHRDAGNIDLHSSASPLLAEVYAKTSDALKKHGRA